MNKKITVDILMFIAIIVEFLSMPILIHEIDCIAFEIQQKVF